MAEMQWYAATDSGRFDGTAVITPRSGAVCLRAELPAGVLQNAVAALPWEMADDEKLFMNGYQSWTACPELGKWDRQHGVEHVPASKAFGGKVWRDQKRQGHGAAFSSCSHCA